MNLVYVDNAKSCSRMNDQVVSLNYALPTACAVFPACLISKAPHVKGRLGLDVVLAMYHEHVNLNLDSTITLVTTTASTRASGGHYDITMLQR